MRMSRQTRVALLMAITTTAALIAQPIAAQATPGVCQCASSDSAGSRGRFPGIAFLPLLFFVPLLGGTPPIPPIAAVPAAPAVSPVAPTPPAGAVPAPVQTVAVAPLPDSLPYGVRPPNTATIFPALALAGVLALLSGALASRLPRRRRTRRDRAATRGTTSRRGAVQIICYTGGAALLFIATLSYLRAGLARDRARDAWAVAMAPDAGGGAALRGGAAASLSRARTSGEPIARLRIPAISLDEVVVEGVDSDALDAGPGHFPGSALPGELGNSIISAHRDRQFNRFAELAVGDTVATQTALGVQWWKITGRRIVPKDERSLFQTRDATLTLTTCWPVRYVGPAPERLLLTAKPLLRLPGA